MTDDRMALLALIEKRADADLVREMLGFAAGRLMEAEMQLRAGAAHGERDPARLVQRNGYRAGPGMSGPGGSSRRSRACAGAATSPPASSPGAPPRRR